jgi:predicted glycoside hydrolase/deacetylase ChbG (UPF0249 family)
MSNQNLWGHASGGFYMSKKSPPDQFATTVFCADDYGLAAGVNAAIAALIDTRRITATSCMTTSPDWPPGAALLRGIVAGAPADVGLHLTLTDQPALSGPSALVPNGYFPALATTLVRGLLRGLPRAALRTEIRAQFDAFEESWGGPPDHVDGHQHVHLLPTVREELIAELTRRRFASARSRALSGLSAAGSWRG